MKQQCSSQDGSEKQTVQATPLLTVAYQLAVAQTHTHRKNKIKQPTKKRVPHTRKYRYLSKMLEFTHGPVQAHLTRLTTGGDPARAQQQGTRVELLSCAVSGAWATVELLVVCARVQHH